MLKNILLGALAGAAVAYLLVEKKNQKSMEQAYHHMGDYFHTVRQKLMNKFEKGKGQVGLLGERAGKMGHHHMKNQCR